MSAAVSVFSSPSGLLHAGDNLPILRESVSTGSVDLCYIDPPFYSRRDYAMRGGGGAVGPAHAFTDRWGWDDRAAAGFDELPEDAAKALLRGLRAAFGACPLLAYLTHLAARLTELHRVLAAHGTLYAHVDASAGHYVKLLCDVVFLPRGGEFRNEIVWSYESGGRTRQDFAWKHDTILRYTKSATWTFNAGAIQTTRALARRNHMKREVDPDGRVFRSIRSAGKIYRYYEDEGVTPSDVWTDLSHLHQRDPERVGYPTQKPEVLLERILLASSHPGDLVLDAYCGGGTTLAVAQRLGRRWIGIDQSPAAIATTCRRLGLPFTPSAISPTGIPPAAPAARADPTPG